MFITPVKIINYALLAWFILRVLYAVYIDLRQVYQPCHVFYFKADIDMIVCRMFLTPRAYNIQV